MLTYDPATTWWRKRLTDTTYLGHNNVKLQNSRQRQYMATLLEPV